MKNGLTGLIVLLFYVFAAGVPPARGCTAFRSGNGPGSLVSRNLDWPVSEGIVIVSPRGISRTGIVPGPDTPLKWQVRYGNVTLSQFGNGLPLEGMNECGLTVVELSLSISRYPPGSDLPALNEFQVVQFLLDTCDTTADAVTALDSFRVVPVLFHLQYFVCDRSGNTAVIQYLDGTCRVFSGDGLPVPVTTNNRYENMIRYLTRHRGFGGARLVSNGPESPERFVRAATLLKDLPTDLENPLETAMHIQDAVSQSDTAWRTVYDPMDRKLMVRIGKDTPDGIAIHLEGFSFQPGTGVRSVPLAELGHTGFLPWEPEWDRTLLERVFSALSDLGQAVPMESRQLLLEHGK